VIYGLSDWTEATCAIFSHPAQAKNKRPIWKGSYIKPKGCLTAFVLW